jgi:hypothetical protein
MTQCYVINSETDSVIFLTKKLSRMSSKRRPSLVSHVTKLFVKASLQPTNHSLNDREEEPEIVLNSASQPSMKRMRSFEKKRAQISRLSLTQSRPEEKVSASPVKTPDNSAAISLADLSKGAGHRFRVKSMAPTSNREFLPNARHSLPLGPEAGLPLRPLLPLNQQYPSLGDFEVVKTIGMPSFFLAAECVIFTPQQHKVQPIWLPKYPSHHPP